MKRILFTLLIVAPFCLAAQTTTKTESFTVNGKVKSPVTITLADVKKLKAYNLGDVVITNHLGEVKSTAKNLSGVLLKDVLKDIALDTDQPKLYSEYYFVCRGNDGYKVVYSWNELFNTPIGNSVYLLTEKNQETIQQMKESILMLSSQDERTGRRYLKNLEAITVRRAE
ncbi:hypothetical protein [Chryseolinea lacunae]|uniref:Molybdopterin-binding protein n=1 Tax=Chryseolinea lacunae TaxID=2801331 RepID=A0ABS1KVR4_9BACT|nr:hypothetical protein [Chryseolinea lacunae]MBL0742777.1 hypothetical protein [Chryseolinea lacunae]